MRSLPQKVKDQEKLRLNFLFFVKLRDISNLCNVVDVHVLDNTG